MNPSGFLMLVAALAISLPARGAEPVVSGPVVSVVGVASASVANDRMTALVRAEAEAATPAAAANEVNTRIAQALAKARSATGVEAKTAGYSTWQMNEKGKPARWRAVQSIALEATDFTALAGLVSRLQEDGLLLGTMQFSVRAETRRRTEDALTQQAIRSWQQRAELAATGLGFAAWRPGRVSVNTGDAAHRPEPVYRAQMAAAGGGAAPVAIEAGTTEITVTVSGDAVLQSTK